MLIMALAPSARGTVTKLPPWRVSWRIYRRIFGLLRPHLGMTLLTVLCVLLATGFALVVPALLAWVIDTGIHQGNLMDLAFAAGGVLVISSLRGLFAYGQGYYSQALAAVVAYDLRNKVYAHLQRLSFDFHDDSETGQLMARMTVDIESIRQFIPLGFVRVITSVLTFGGVIAILAQISWPMTLLALFSLPIIAVLAFQVARKLGPMWRNVQNETGDLSTVMQESLSGRRVVMSFAREAYESRKYMLSNRRLRDVQMDAMRTSAWNQPLMVFVVNAITVLALGIGGVAVIEHQMTLGDLFAVTQYILLLGTPVRAFGYMMNWLLRTLASGQRIFDVLDAQPSIADAPNAVMLENVAGHVRFEDVSFTYKNGRAVLHDISLDAQPGQVVAILGATGSGKSTLLSLLPRFYDVTSGRITVDGYDVRDIKLTSLRRNIGMVLQDVFLFNATIRENIALGVAGATDEQVIAAAKVARLHDFIMALPDGYDTWVGERGVTLSGGQKQRLAIARTLLLDPRILVLDDSTSSVDMETEYLIHAALDAVMEGRTSFVVASRLRTIKHADQIIVLDQGRIVERGTHAQLLAAGGTYARLYDLQLREQEESETRRLKERELVLNKLDSDQS
jgi:ABC-type multidrug transport system fused ATPase/permease subunit